MSFLASIKSASESAKLEVDKKSITFSSYEPISEYPSSTRDFSFLVDDLTKVNEVINMLDKVSDKIIKKIFIFDFYKNEKSGFVKLGYRFIFQSYHTTLLDLEINNKVQEIISPIIEMDGVSIPGM